MLAGRPEGLGEGFDLALSEERARSALPSDSDWSWALPGLAEACGRDPDHLALRYRICPENHVIPFVDVCDRRSCPTCWRKGWLRREAGLMAAKLGAESTARRDRGAHHRVVHVSVNPAPELWDEPNRLRGYRKLRAAAYRVARKAGIEAGGAVFHRIRCADKDDPIATDGPHFHVLGFGWVKEGFGAVKGWKVVNHGVRIGPRAVRGAAEYVLSHSYRAEGPPRLQQRFMDGEGGGTSQEGKSEGLTLTVTWFGREVAAEEIPSEGPFCPLCERCWPSDRWIDAQYLGPGPPPTSAIPVDWSLWRAWMPDPAHFGDRISVERR